MSDPFDVFQLENGAAVLWRAAAATIEEAKEHIREFAKHSPGVYLILNQGTGEKIVVKPEDI